MSESQCSLCAMCGWTATSKIITLFRRKGFVSQLSFVFTYRFRTIFFFDENSNLAYDVIIETNHHELAISLNYNYFSVYV